MIHPLWYLCLLIRLFIAFNLTSGKKYFNYIKPFILLIGIGFAYKALTGSNDETQIAKVFWHETRFIHSMFYFLAYLSSDITKSSRFLMFDVVFSIIYRSFNKK